MENAFNSIANKAIADFGRKNDVCDIYVEPTEGSGADEEEEDVRFFIFFNSDKNFGNFFNHLDIFQFRLRSNLSRVFL